jgi:Uma2 family endonuclease
MIIPLIIPHSDAFTDIELSAFCLANPDLGVERDENGQIYISMSPSYIFTSNLNSEIVAELIIWNRKYKLGKVLESNSAFFLPDNSMRGPDAAFVSNKQWESLSPEQIKSIPYLVPQFVVELKSETDNIDILHQKMKIWIKNGVNLAWLINPTNKTTTIYKPDADIEIIEFNNKLFGGSVLPNFEVIWNDIFNIV